MENGTLMLNGIDYSNGKGTLVVNGIIYSGGSGAPTYKLLNNPSNTYTSSGTFATWEKYGDIPDIEISSDLKTITCNFSGTFDLRIYGRFERGATTSTTSTDIEIYVNDVLEQSITIPVTNYTVLEVKDFVIKNGDNIKVGKTNDGKGYLYLYSLEFLGKQSYEPITLDYGIISIYASSLGISNYVPENPLATNNINIGFRLSNVSGFEGFSLPIYVNAENAGDYKVSCDVIHTSERTGTTQYVNYWGLAVTNDTNLSVLINDENARFPNKNTEGSCYTTFTVDSGTGYTRKYLIFSLGGVGGLGDWTITNLKIEKI